MMTRQKKEQVLKGLKEDISKACALFQTNLIGIKSNDANALRKELWNVKGKVVVAKNTLFKRAVQGTYAEKSWSNLKGSSAMVFAFEDPAAVAKCFKKMEDLETIALRGGYLEEKELDLKQIKALANLPARPQMLATLLAGLVGPLSPFAPPLGGPPAEKKRKKKKTSTARKKKKK
ncbi:MAG: 50S ribosomal protein L10, partial [Halobacteriovoraceae bacterium]|nr:50S ribosomal protein L10 [Halobacteriovoraceae bacterium]